jgi:hypothetical protein
MQPIVHQGKVIEYETDPVEYLKQRRKLQNRISAGKMRQTIKGQLEQMQANQDKV